MANTFFIGKSGSYIGQALVGESPPPFVPDNQLESPISNAGLYRRYFECSFVAATATVLLAALGPQPAQARAPLYTPVFSRGYNQVEQQHNLLPTLYAVPAAPKPFFAVDLPGWTGPRYYAQIEPHQNPLGVKPRDPLSQKDWQNPSGFRYYAQVDPIPNLLAKPTPIRARDLPTPTGYRYYSQVEPFLNPRGINPRDPVAQYDWPVPQWFRYYSQVEPFLNPLGVQPRNPVRPFDWQNPSRWRYSDLSSSYSLNLPLFSALAGAPPFRPVDLTPSYKRANYRQPEIRRPTPDAGPPAVPPPDVKPFLQNDWPNPRRAPQTRFDDPPNLLNQTLGAKLVAWADDDTPEGYRYSIPSEYQRNNLIFAGVVTALPQINNDLESAVVYRLPYYYVEAPPNLLHRGLVRPIPGRVPENPIRRAYAQQPDIFPNLVLRHGVVTALFQIQNYDWPITLVATWQQEEDFPNLVTRDQVATALFPIQQGDWPVPIRALYNQTENLPSLLVAELKPGPLAYSQRAVMDTPRGFRYVAQPEIVPNNVILGIPPRGATRLPFSLTDWPVPRRADAGPALHEVWRGTQISNAGPPFILPTVTLVATPTSLFVGQSALLTWSTTDAASAVASLGWTGAKALSGSEVVGPLLATTVFGLTATNTFGDAFASVVVTVTAIPIPPEPTPSPASPIPVRPGGRTVISVSSPGEIAMVKFDFISSVKKIDAIIAQVVTASVYSGVDPNPANIIVGNATANGTIIKQSVRGGNVGVVYKLLCRCTTASGHNPEMSAFFTVSQPKGV